MGKYVVSARKYRPARFSEVVGQQHITSTLETALRTDHLAHAFLFCGPRGVGKTTCARILARTLNCENVQNTVDPCGECGSCKAFEKNASFNIIELDAASNNSVEHIRALNDQVRFSPQQGRYKVYIIDEVHMLTSQAFNAFLKTLEEPPDYAIFILATTEKHKIIPTILSRCQIFDFKRIMVKDMVEHLEGICSKEGIKAERDALTIIAQKSDGALRDALSLFDRLASVSNGTITYKGVVENLNLLDYEVFFKTADACAREDVRDVLLIFDKVIRDGFEGDAFLNGLASHYRDLLVCRDPRTLELQDHSEELKQRYVNQASALSLSFIFSALNIINEADIAYPQVTNKRLHVEMALSKVCLINHAIKGNPFDTEKKTARATVNPAPTPKPSEKEQPAPVVEAPPAPKVKIPKPTEVQETAIPTKPLTTPEKPVVQATPTVKPAAPRPVPKSTVKPAFQSKAPGPIPQLSSIASIKQSIQETEKLAKDNSLALNMENLQQWWVDYQKDITSPSVQSTFKNTELGLENKSVILKVGSPMAKTRILEEAGLLSSLRQIFHDPDLQIEFEISELPEDLNKPKKLMTTREKYELLVNKNPDMQQLRTKLDLIIDQDD